MYIAIVDYDQHNRVTKYQDYKTQAEADAHVARVLDKYPKAFTAPDPGGGFAAWLVNPAAKAIFNSPHVETQKEKGDKLKLEKDFLRMKEAVLNVTLNWASLENAMAFLLESIISKSNYQLGFAIYFSVASADARFDIVNNAIVSIFEKNKRSVQLLNLWARLFLNLKGVKKSRNTVTHGNILPIKKPNYKKIHVRLTPALFHKEMIKQWTEPELPGLSINDVEQAAKRINEFANLLVRIPQIILYIDTENEPRLIETIRELEGRLPKIPAPQ